MTDTLSQKPLVKPLLPATETRRGIDAAITGGLSPALSAGSRAAGRLVWSKREMLHALHRQLHTADTAERRAHWLGGRLLNWAAGERGDYLRVTGVQMQQILRAGGFRTPAHVPADREYLLRVDVARAAYRRLRAEIMGPDATA